VLEAVKGMGIKERLLVGVPEMTPVLLLKLRPTELKEVMVLAGSEKLVGVPPVDAVKEVVTAVDF
jgi:hypothetical protein